MFEKAITLLFISGEPITYKVLGEQLGCSQEEIVSNAHVLKTSLEAIGLTLIVTPYDLSMATKGEYASLVEGFRKKDLEGELTPAMLQVLTLVAYLGNGTHDQISYIRGIQSSQSLRTLVARGLINKSNKTYTLTVEALAHLGITKSEDLPDYLTIHAGFLEKLQTENGYSS